MHQQPTNRVRLRTLACLALICLHVGAVGHAELHAPELSDAELAALPLVSVHITAVSPDLPGEVTVLIPRPANTITDDHLALLTEDCLVPVASAVTEPEEPLGLIVRLENAERCMSRAVVVFETIDGPALGTAAVVVARAPAPVLPHEIVSKILTVDRVLLPWEWGRGPAASVPLLHLTLTNVSTETVTITALLEEPAIREFAGALFTSTDGSYDGNWTSLEAGTEGFVPAELAPGTTVEYFLAVDAAGLLPSGSWAVTLRPAFEVEFSGEHYSLVLDQVSWYQTPRGSP
ncbi:MAG: hypothetical protein KF813_05170 [Trueperaceae bacterium]|nr:hypothetical protein [Trueperaceae bacterium]